MYFRVEMGTCISWLAALSMMAGSRQLQPEVGGLHGGRPPGNDARGLQSFQDPERQKRCSLAEQHWYKVDPAHLSLLSSLARCPSPRVQAKMLATGLVEVGFPC